MKINTIKNILNVGFASLMLLATSSCTDNFDRWNTNQHEATDEMMTHDNLSTGSYFVQMQKNVFVLEQMPEIGAAIYQITQNLAGDIYSGYMGATNTWNACRNNTTYELSNDWKDSEFERCFVGIMPAWNAIIKESKKLEQPQVGALATIVKVEALHRATDMYGPLPYLGFGDNEKSNDYNSQEEIYNSFFDELTQSIDVLTDFYTKDSKAKVLEEYDFIFFGDVQKWIKFANTLKLRLALRIAYANPTKAQTMAEEAVNHTVGVITAPTEVVKLNHSEKLSYRHPLYVIAQGEFNDTRMGATMDSYLNGYNDPRISSYFKLSNQGEYTGIRNGINIIREKYADKGPFSDLNISASSDVVWMNPAEAYFLRAEGALRGWNMGGTAQELYEEGIKTSFKYLGVSGVDAYLTNDSAIPAEYVDLANSSNNARPLSNITIKWQDADNFERKLERIITQKWIAMFPDGQEAWSEFRRTSYPKVFPNVLNYSNGAIDTNTQIRRLPFPNSEYRNNQEAVSKATTLLGGADNGGTKLWWDKK